MEQKFQRLDLMDIPTIGNSVSWVILVEVCITGKNKIEDFGQGDAHL